MGGYGGENKGRKEEGNKLTAKEYLIDTLDH